MDTSAPSGLVVWDAHKPLLRLLGQNRGDRHNVLVKLVSKGQEARDVHGRGSQFSTCSLKATPRLKFTQRLRWWRLIRCARFMVQCPFDLPGSRSGLRSCDGRSDRFCSVTLHTDCERIVDAIRAPRKTMLKARRVRTHQAQRPGCQRQREVSNGVA